MEKLEVFYTIFMTIILGAYVVLFIPLVKIETKLLEKLHKKTKSVQNTGVIGFFIFGAITPIINIVALAKYDKKHKKLRATTYSEATKKPTVQSIDNLIDYIECYGCQNEPQYWKQLRGVWFAVNESSQVPSAKKRELRDFLTTNGLRLVGNDKNVIDNYKGY